MGFIQKIFHTDEWYDNLKKPSITPPKWAFPVVWTTLYIMIAASLYFYVRKTGFVLTAGLVVYVIQFVLNMLWTPIFFWGKMISLALIEVILMWIFILVNIILFMKVD